MSRLFWLDIKQVAPLVVPWQPLADDDVSIHGAQQVPILQRRHQPPPICPLLLNVCDTEIDKDEIV